MNLVWSAILQLTSVNDDENRHSATATTESLERVPVSCQSGLKIE